MIKTVVNRIQVGITRRSKTISEVESQTAKEAEEHIDQNVVIRIVAMRILDRITRQSMSQVESQATKETEEHIDQTVVIKTLKMRILVEITRRLTTSEVGSQIMREAEEHIDMNGVIKALMMRILNNESKSSQNLKCYLQSNQ